MPSGGSTTTEERRAEARRLFLVHLLDGDLQMATGFKRCAEVLDPALGEQLLALEREPYRRRSEEG